MKYVTPIFLTVLLLGGILIDFGLQSKINCNTKLINDNLVLLTKIKINVDRIDTEQKNRQSKVYSIPAIDKRTQPRKIEELSGIIKTNLKGNIQDVSEGVEILTGFDEDQLVGSNLRMLMGEELWKAHQGYIAKVISRGDPGLVMERRNIKIFDKDVEISVSYIPTEEIFIVNIKEI